MVTQVEHNEIPDIQLHEPKGASTAAAQTFYVADGAGSGVWQSVTDLVALPAYPVGAILDWAGTTAPNGWELCYGQVLQRATYVDLFAVVGNTYGAGDGSITFNVPDLRSYLVAGQDDMGGVSANRLTTPLNGDTLGATGGTQTVVISSSNVPTLTGTTNTTGSHTHTMPFDVIGPISGGNDTPNPGSGTNVRYRDVTMQSAGSHTHTVTVNSGSANSAHSNVQPTIVFNKIIFHGVFS
jgi:microcystin-dependent protein